MSRNVTYGFNEKKEKVDVWDDEYINKEFQKVIYKDDIAIIYGKLTLNNGAANHNIDYPVGFNKDNCVVLTFMANNTTNNHWGYGYIEISAGYTGGAIGHRVTLQNDNISVGINNPMDGEHNNGTGAFDYKIVLMKLPVIDITGMYKGDLNEDGQVTAEDKTLVDAFLQETGALTGKQFKLADVNRDGVVDSGDLLKIQRYLFGYDEPELFSDENQ